MRAARGEVYHELGQLRRQLQPERAAAIEKARHEAEAQIAAAKAELQQEVSRLKQKLAGESDALATQIAESILRAESGMRAPAFCAAAAGLAAGRIAGHGAGYAETAAEPRDQHERGRSSEGPSPIWAWANFAILAGVLGYLIVKKGGPWFASRSQAIRKGIADAEEIRRKAEASAAEVDRRLAGLETEIEACARTRIGSRRPKRSESGSRRRPIWRAFKSMRRVKSSRRQRPRAWS